MSRTDPPKISVTMALNQLAEASDKVREAEATLAHLRKERNKLFREAYDAGVRLTKLASYSGMNRATVYDCITSTRPEDY